MLATHFSAPSSIGRWPHSGISSYFTAPPALFQSFSNFFNPSGRGTSKEPARSNIGVFISKRVDTESNWGGLGEGFNRSYVSRALTPDTKPLNDVFSTIFTAKSEAPPGEPGWSGDPTGNQRPTVCFAKAPMPSFLANSICCSKKSINAAGGVAWVSQATTFWVLLKYLMANAKAAAPPCETPITASTWRIARWSSIRATSSPSSSTVHVGGDGTEERPCPRWSNSIRL